MKLKKMHWVGIIAGTIIIIGDLIFFLDSQKMLLFLIGLALGIGSLPFIMSISLENKRENKLNEMFLEFSRDLAEGAATGTPISKAIINMKKRNFGVLSPYVQKLANQIELGVPVEKALATFSKDIDSSVIKRATALINEAERSGGEIDYILSSTAKSISEVEKLKKERKSAIYNLVVQGYIIFFVFLGILLVMEFKIIPLTSGVGDLGGFGGANIQDFEKTLGGESSFTPKDFSLPLLYLILTQGLFMGLVIGKITEGRLKSGIKHSLILMTTAFLVSGGARLFFSSS